MNDIMKITDKIYELYKIYETYAWHNNHCKLVVHYRNNNTISIYLYQNDELLDDVHINFTEKEKPIYEVLSLNLFILTIGNVEIHKLGNDMYYNAHHKPYLLIISSDKEITKTLDTLVSRQNDEVLSLDMDIIKDKSKKIKKKTFNKKFIEAIDNRTQLTETLFRRW